jgi:hypothetical protein
MALASQLELVAPIAFKNPEYPRMRAKDRENAGGSGSGIRGGSGMSAGDWDRRRAAAACKRDRKRTAGSSRFEGSSVAPAQ